MSGMKLKSKLKLKLDMRNPSPVLKLFLVSRWKQERKETTAWKFKWLPCIQGATLVKNCNLAV